MTAESQNSGANTGVHREGAGDALGFGASARPGARPLAGAADRVQRLPGEIRMRWRRLSLYRQFAITSAAVLTAGMIVLGLWVSDRIKQGVVSNSAASLALFMDRYVAPLVQELGTGGELSPATRAALDQLKKQAAVSSRVVALKIWRPDGVVAYSTRPEQIGERVVPSGSLQRALRGVVAADYDATSHGADGESHGTDGPVLEIYAPVLDRGDARVIAVAEFYERADGLKTEIARAETMSWLVVGAVTAMMLAALAGIVGRGSRTIDRQRQRLESQVGELRTLLAENRELGSRVRRAYARTGEINDLLLRRVGADLHDGPAQHLSLALLRLDGLSPPASASLEPTASPAAANELERVRGSLLEAMKELRQISAGLQLPELRGASLAETLVMAARAHERRTDTRVAIDITPAAVTVDATIAIKAALYRFVQEGLNNAFRHANARGQTLSLAVAPDGVLSVSVEDAGPGIPVEDSGHVAVCGKGLGLSGMRDRMECLGGAFEIGRSASGGARLTARFHTAQLNVGGQHDG